MENDQVKNDQLAQHMKKESDATRLSREITAKNKAKWKETPPKPMKGCWNRFLNIIDRKNSKFCVEAIP